MKKGFTLIELLIVILIIGIIALIAIPNLLVALQKGKQKATMADMRTMDTAVEAYNTDIFAYPSGIGSAILTNFWNKTLISQDSWNTGFDWVVDQVAENYSLTSFGKNKAAGPITVGSYLCNTLANFDNDLTISRGSFTCYPRVK